jgi:hypothetical protein
MRRRRLTHRINQTARTAAESGINIAASASIFLPNVKDEPRRELARRVPQSELRSESSFRLPFGRTRRDRSRRWLWRLVSHFFRLNSAVVLPDAETERVAAY